jgi:hypothetical protein
MPLNTTTPSRLFHAKLSASEADLTLIDTLTEVPAGERWVCLSITVTNNDTVDRTVLLRFVADGETPGDEHNILPGQTTTVIKAGDTKIITGRWNLHEGDKVRGSCSSANKVTVRGDGIRIVL